MVNYTLRNAKMKMPGMMNEQMSEYAQRLDFDTIQLPEVAMWQPGEEYLLVVKVKETKHEITKENGKTEEKACFDVLEVGAIADQSPKYKEEAKKLFK